MNDINIVVIGGGPGGYVAAIRAAQLGAQVTLIEKDKMGGTCLNVGCIPTKVLLHAAELMSADAEAADFGIQLNKEGFDWEKLQGKKEKITGQLVKGVTGLMKSNGIEVLKGKASFCSPEILKVVFEDGSEKKFTPEKIIIATGSVPAVPPIKGLKESKGWIDSTKALSLEKVPKSMIVIGGGVIGIEMATIYSQLGCEITVIEAMPKILPLMDEELGTLLARRMGRKKIKIMTSTSVLSVEDKDDEVEVTISDGKEEKTLLAEKVLVAVGRKSYTDTLNLDESGIEYDGSRILVNDRMETNVPGIYAIGDCTGSTMLAHVASAQGEIAAENAMNGKRSYDESTCPSCVYTSPEFAGVGLTEAKAAQMGYKYKIGKFPLKANGKALIMNNGEGVVKFVVEEESDKILGVHILGSRATDLIGEAAIAIGMGASIEDLANVIHAHPTLSEAIREGALSSIHLAIHIPNK